MINSVKPIDSVFPFLAFWRFGVFAVIFSFAIPLFAQTATSTPTVAPTPALTPTFTPTTTPTFTSTLTSTPTGTRSPVLTPTSTSTNSPTPSLTNTPTGTLSPVLTPTHTRTATITGTPTATPTKTATVTPTSTATPGVFKFAVSPKPDEKGEIHFAWGTNVPASEAFLRVYTSGFRLVWEKNFNKEENPDFLTAGSHQTTWNAKDDQDRPMPPGSYLCFISVTVGKKTYDASGKTEIP